MIATSPPNPSLEDEWKIVQEAKKNPKEFKPIYNRYYYDIFRFVLARVKDQETAADIVSSAFTKAIAKLDSFNNRGFSIKSWLYAIARNEVLLHYRNEKKAQIISLDDASIKHMGEDTETDLLEHLPTLKKALDELDTEESEIITLKYFEGRSHKEISEILDISETNAKVKMHRIIKKLRTVFQKIQSHE